MTINEIKDNYHKLQQLKHKLTVLTSDPFVDVSTKQVKIRKLEKQIDKLKDFFEKLEKIHILDLDDSFKEYFKAKNIKTKIHTSIDEESYIRDDFYGRDTYTHYNIKTYLKIKTKNKETKNFLTVSYSDYDYPKYYENNYYVDGISVLDNLLKNDKDTLMLRKHFPNVTDCVWNAYAIYFKRMIDEKLDEKEKEKSLIQKMIAKLKDPTHIANEINKLQKKVDKINEEENKLKGDIFNVDLK